MERNRERFKEFDKKDVEKRQIIKIDSI